MLRKWEVNGACCPPARSLKSASASRRITPPALTRRTTTLLTLQASQYQSLQDAVQVKNEGASNKLLRAIDVVIDNIRNSY